MSKNEHTPGPWNIGEDSDVFGYENSTCVAKVCGAPENIPEAVANARLIAAAPALLDACKEAENTFAIFGEVVGFPDMGPECWGVIDTLRDAIAQTEKGVKNV